VNRDLHYEDTRREVCAAIEQYRQMVQNEHGHAVLDRLSASSDDEYYAERVLPAFKAAPRDRWSTLLYACVRAGEVQRQHKEVIEQAKRDIEAADEAEEALHRVEDFLARGARSVPVSDAIAFHLLDNSAKFDPIQDGIRTDYKRDDRRAQTAVELLRSQIDSARRRAKDELRLRSQKTDDGGSRLAAVGLIKAAVRDAAPCARNLRKITAGLATAVLEEEVFEDAVGHAKSPREWLVEHDTGGFPLQKS
jgi:hypothetical protein